MSGKKSRFYFYSDLNGTLLFDGALFNYATPFSEKSAVVKDCSDKWYIINLNSRERILFPDEFSWQDFTDFRNSAFALCDSKSKKWGTYSIDYDTHLWQPDIPFVWDFLSLSRNPELVYAGVEELYNYYPNWESGPYNHMIPDRYDSVKMTVYKVAQLQKAEAQDLTAFSELEKHIDNYFWSASARTHFISDIDSNAGDRYFHEEPNNSGLIVKTFSLEDYPITLSRLKK